MSKRIFSKNAGFREKRVNVRTQEDARELDELIEKQLVRFVRAQFSESDYIEKFSPQVREALEQVLLIQGSPNYITPHGAFSTFLTTLLESGLTAEVAPAVAVYTAVYPTSVDYVLKSVPAKTINYLCRYTNSDAVVKWTEENSDWQARITASLKDGTFTSFLRQIRESIGAANINYHFLKMLERFFHNIGELNPSQKKEIEEILAHAPKTLSLSPREWNKECNSLRALILHFMLIDLEDRYGVMEDGNRTFKIPFYNRLREEQGVMNSQIISFHPDHPLALEYDYGICIGWRYDSWEQFFYQVSHEAVHLLNPVMNPGGNPKVSALEEGVAVRYAEEMLEKYLPYVSRAFVDSPIGENISYHDAWQVTCKLPDTILHQVRQEFGSFGAINDPARFASITSKWLTSEEANLLSGHFHY
ncbi:hypothetical protein ACP179_01470 (plasmid) [Xenorhabdus stockiae]|uniref:hypothetical protein n=1 Tax=Xenorhabdus stockiae TaxID=351614 RepID=UPI003CEEC22B